MKHANNVDPVWKGQVEDNVLANDKAANAFAQFGPGSANTRLTSQHVKLVVDEGGESVSMSRTAFGDVIPDFGEIDQGTRTFNNQGHLLPMSGRLTRSQPLASFSFHLFHVPRCTRPAFQPFADVLP